VGGAIRLSVLQGLTSSGRNAGMIFAAVRQSFETFNDIVGYSKAPNYGQLKFVGFLLAIVSFLRSPCTEMIALCCCGCLVRRHASIDPNYVKVTAEDTGTKPRKTLTKEEDMKRIVGPVWDHLRETSHSQLLHVAVRELWLGM
jgi:hypothetical protein